MEVRPLVLLPRQAAAFCRPRLPQELLFLAPQLVLAAQLAAETQHLAAAHLLLRYGMHLPE